MKRPFILPGYRIMLQLKGLFQSERCLEYVGILRLKGLRFGPG